MTPSELLCQLISIPSVNPMGREASGDICFEHRLSDWLVEFFKNLGVAYERIEVLPGRDNVIARYEGHVAAPTVLWDAHQDTVPVDGMTVAPFKPTINGGRIYGRGATDVKGGLACMLHAFERLVLESPADAPSVIMSCSCDEEATATGVQALVNYWQAKPSRSRLLAIRPSMAIVAEPTELDVVVAHRGVLRFRAHTTGKACHSSQSENGINAIYKMAQVIDRLALHAKELEQDPNVHPLCGGARLSVGRIDGGVAVNVVPDHCWIEIDRRLMPGEEPDAVKARLQAMMAGQVSDIHFDPPWLSSPALGDGDNTELADRLLACVNRVVGERRKIGVPFGTNASSISAAGVPSVVFGPGSIAQAHTCDEFIDISQLDAAAEIFFQFCSSHFQ